MSLKVSFRTLSVHFRREHFSFRALQVSFRRQHFSFRAHHVSFRAHHVIFRAQYVFPGDEAVPQLGWGFTHLRQAKEAFFLRLKACNNSAQGNALGTNKYLSVRRELYSKGDKSLLRRKGNSSKKASVLAPSSLKSSSLRWRAVSDACQ